MSMLCHIGLSAQVVVSVDFRQSPRSIYIYHGSLPILPTTTQNVGFFAISCHFFSHGTTLLPHFLISWPILRSFCGEDS